MSNSHSNDQDIRNIVSMVHSQKLMHGSPNARFWFVGLEGGNHPDAEEVEQFLAHRAAHQEGYNAGKFSNLRGYECLEGLCNAQCPEKTKCQEKHYHPCKVHGKTTKVKWQATYGGYIKLLLSLTRENWTLNDVKEYQRQYLGEVNGNPSISSALLELYPMDNQRKKAWPYKHLGKIAGLEYLKTARKYREWALEPEWNKVLESIRQYQPEYVFVFGADAVNLARNNRELNYTLKPIETKGKNKTIDTGFASLYNSRITFARHPAGRTSDLYWKNIAAELFADNAEKLAA